jgi:hypothetical protein
LILWALLVASAVQAAARFRLRALQILPYGVVLLLLAMLGLGHFDEGRFRKKMADIGLEWIEGLGTAMDALDKEPHSGAPGERVLLMGPAASVVIGFPDRPAAHQAPLLGVKVAGYVQPPYTQRYREGDSFHHLDEVGAYVNRPSAIPAIGHVLDLYPWPVWVFTSPGDQQVPVQTSVLPSLKMSLPQSMDLYSKKLDEKSNRFHIPMRGQPARFIGAIGLRSKDGFPVGTHLKWSPAGEVGSFRGEMELQAGFPKDLDVWLPIRLLEGAALDPTGSDLWVDVSCVSGGVPESVGVKIVSELPKLITHAPRIGDHVKRGEMFPVIRFEDTGYSPTYRVTIKGHGLRAPIELNGVYTIPRSAIARDEAGLLTLDVLKHFQISEEVWNASITALAERQPELNGMTVWIEIEGVVGSALMVQSRCDAIPIKIEY